MSRECGKCGKNYEPYMALIPDNTVDYSRWFTMKEKYDWFCQECFSEENPKSGIVLLDTN